MIISGDESCSVFVEDVLRVTADNAVTIERTYRFVSSAIDPQALTFEQEEETFGASDSIQGQAVPSSTVLHIYRGRPNDRLSRFSWEIHASISRGESVEIRLGALLRPVGSGSPAQYEVRLHAAESVTYAVRVVLDPDAQMSDGPKLELDGDSHLLAPLEQSGFVSNRHKVQMNVTGPSVVHLGVVTT